MLLNNVENSFSKANNFTNPNFCLGIIVNCLSGQILKALRL